MRLGPPKHENRVCREKVFQAPTETVGEILKTSQETPYFLDLQMASKRSNCYRDHFEAVSGFANGVKEVKLL